MSSYFTLGPYQTGEKYWPPRLPATPISGPLPQPNSINYANTSSFAGLKSEFSLWEEDVSKGIGRWKDILAHDPERLKKLEKENRLPSPHADLVHQRWGFLIIRTDYSAESDGLLPRVMEKIHRWMLADLDAIMEPGVVLPAAQREAIGKSFMNLLLDDKAVYDGLKLEEVYIYFKAFLRTHELDWALVRGPEEPYVEEDDWNPLYYEYSWRNEQHSCCNPDCLHPSHEVKMKTDISSRNENEEARKARRLREWEIRKEAELRSSYGKPFYLHPEILEQAKTETDLRRKWLLMKEAEWKLSPQTCFVLDLEVMRSINKHDVDPDKYGGATELTYTQGPFLKISLEDKMSPEGDNPDTLCGKCHIAVNPLAMVYTQMAEESQHEFDIEWGYNGEGKEYDILLRAHEEGLYPELQSVVAKERAEDNPYRAEKDGDHEKAERLHAGISAKLAKWSQERTPDDEKRLAEWIKRQKESPEEIEYQRKWFGTELPSEESNYEEAWKQWASSDSKA